MDARQRLSRMLLAFAVIFFVPVAAMAAGAEFRTTNFIVLGAPNAQFAKQVAQEAERYRHDLAIHWLGRELPQWEAPCILNVVAGNIPAQGVTNYVPLPGAVRDFRMEVVGTPERILDSVLPHEITHAVLASHFKRPLPRWADEGIATTVEHQAEKSKHDVKLREFLTTGRGIPMNKMFMMKEYPKEMLTLYAQGYSVCRFLIDQQGPQEFIRFIESYFHGGSWTQAVNKHYQYESLAELQDYWLRWLESGSGPVDRFAKITPATKPGSDIRLASGDSSAAAGTQDPPSVMLAGGSQTSDGWYQRQRDRVLNASASSAAVKTSAFPSISRPQSYSAAQPQPEQGSVPVYSAGPSTRWSPTNSSTIRR